MKYYVMAIEENLIEGEYQEYSPANKKFNDFKSAQTHFFTRLGELSNSATTVFAELKIINSLGGVVKKDSVGEYVDVDATAE